MPKKKRPEASAAFAAGPTVTALPSPLPEGTNVTITGSGFVPGAEVLLDFGHAPAVATPDAAGGFVYEYVYRYNAPGTACVRAMVRDDTTDFAEIARVCWEVVASG